MNSIRQIVILVGGKGTRLGELSRSTPKPLMPIADGKVFLDYTLNACLRQGFAHVILVAGHLGEHVRDLYANRRISGADIDVVIEPSPLGTGGALAHVRAHLADSFVVMNGDTLFDINIRVLDQALATQSDLAGVIALRRVPDIARFGSVSVGDAGLIQSFHEKQSVLEGTEGLVSGGIYALRREIVDALPDGPSSIENDVFPALVAEHRLGSVAFDSYFLDIGLPETLQIARDELPAKKRPVLFLDRDGVLNVDNGYVSTIAKWEWIPGAKELIRNANDAGIAVIVVTNQAGIGRGYYDEPAVWALHYKLQQQLMECGAFVDGFFYCPEHPDALHGSYRIPIPLGRKPRSAMLARAARQHDLDLSRALLVGDQESDMQAAADLGVPALRYARGRLDELVKSSSYWDTLTA